MSLKTIIFLSFLALNHLGHAAQAEDATFQIAKVHMVKPGSEQAMKGPEKKVRAGYSLALQIAYQRINDTFSLMADGEEGVITGSSKIGKHWEQVQAENPGPTYFLPRLDMRLTDSMDVFFKNARGTFCCTQATALAHCLVDPQFLPKPYRSFTVDSGFIEGKSTENNMSKAEFRCTVCISGYFHYLDRTDQSTDLRPGDFVYFNGHPQYTERKPLGMARGENTFFIGYNDEGAKLFVGFGPLFKKGPRTAKDIQMNLAQQYATPDEDIDVIFQAVRGNKFKKRYLLTDKISEMKTVS